MVAAEAELVEQRLGAMMPGAHRDMMAVEHGRHIVRVDAFEIEGQDAEPALPGADEVAARDARQAVDAVAGQRLLVFEDVDRGPAPR